MPIYVGEICALLVTSIFAYFAVQMKLGSFAAPGPGLWPMILCVSIYCLGTVAAFVNYQEKNRASFDLPAMRKPLIAALSIGVYAVAMDYLGYTLPTLMLTGFWLKVIGGEGWRITVILSVVVTSIFWLVFSYLLGVPFPAEIFLD